MGIDPASYLSFPQRSNIHTDSFPLVRIGISSWSATDKTVTGPYAVLS